MARARLSSVEILSRLVSFDTTSTCSNRPLIDWVANYLESWGISSTHVENEDGTKASLFASVGPSVEDGVILSGHTDVVPVAGQPWSSDPFNLTASGRGNRLHGRGTSDMKGFIACALAAVPRLIESPLTRPVHLAFSYDEELGCLAAPALIDAMLEAVPRPAQAIIGEPTGMRLLNAHKGIFAFHTEVTGLEGHSSLPQHGVNAIVYASELIQYLVRLASQLATGPRAEAAFDPPHTTINIGTIQGGNAVNIIARACSFTWEFRPVPGDSPEALQRQIEDFIQTELLPRMQDIHADCAIHTEIRAAVPGLSPQAECPAQNLVREFLEDAGEGPRAAAFATEAGLFQRAGIPSVICGPGHIEQAHKPDEYIERAQLQACDAFMDRLSARLSGP